MRNLFNQFLYYTKGEKAGIIILLTLSILIWVGSRAYPFIFHVVDTQKAEYEKELAEFAAKNPATKQNPVIDSMNVAGATETIIDTPKFKKQWKQKEEYFEFDPNKIGVPEWVRLGFSEKQAITIEHYKEKGGRFYRTEDLKKLYVMTDEHYEKLKPYVNIDVNSLPSRNGKKYRQPY
ncbi:MAG TPA: helix-hairpin-helix domain-containing protein [Chitinophagales bacterium]|nr:helix-hairpin-helix domain-containing protein [Chitinophagales bacterium]